MTESEARQKFCVNKITVSCIASRCMAWRWIKISDEADEELKAIGIKSAKCFFTASICSVGTNLSNAGVSVVPGVITFALIFLLKRSLENAFAK